MLHYFVMRAIIPTSSPITLLAQESIPQEFQMFIAVVICVVAAAAIPLAFSLLGLRRRS